MSLDFIKTSIFLYINLGAIIVAIDIVRHQAKGLSLTQAVRETARATNLKPGPDTAAEDVRLLGLSMLRWPLLFF